jgi:hypothetical protein
MPFKSQAQRRKFAELLAAGKIPDPGVTRPLVPVVLSDPRRNPDHLFRDRPNNQGP